jgi:hypothetical protein
MWGRSTRKRHLGLLLMLGLSATGCASARPASGTVALDRPTPQLHPDWQTAPQETHAALPTESEGEAPITPSRRKPDNPAPPRILRERVLEGRLETGPVIRPDAIHLVSNTHPADRRAAPGRVIGNPLVANLLSEDVKLRRTTIEVIEEARRDGFDFSAEPPDENGVTVIVTLRWLAYGYDADGSWVEPSLDVRRAAIRAIAAIDPHGTEFNKPYCVDPDAVVNVEVKSRSGGVLPGTPTAGSAEMPAEQKRIAQVLPPIPNVDDTITANVAPGVIHRGPESVAVVSNERDSIRSSETPSPVNQQPVNPEIVIREAVADPDRLAGLPSPTSDSPRVSQSNPEPSGESPRPVVDVVSQPLGTTEPPRAQAPKEAAEQPTVPETVLAEVPTESEATSLPFTKPIPDSPADATPAEPASEALADIRTSTDPQSTEPQSADPQSDDPQRSQSPMREEAVTPPTASVPSADNRTADNLAESPVADLSPAKTPSAEPLKDDLPEGEAAALDNAPQAESAGPPPARPQVRMDLDLPATANQAPTASREIPASPTVEPDEESVAETVAAPVSESVVESAPTGQPAPVARAAVRPAAIPAETVRPDVARQDETVLPPDFVPPVVASSTPRTPEAPQGLPVRGRVLQVDGRLGTAWIKLDGAKAIPPAGQRLVVIHRYPLGKLSSMGEVEVLRANITHAEVRPVGGTPISKVAVGDEVSATPALSD